MAAITYPLNPLLYTEAPWTDPDGGLWLWVVRGAGGKWKPVIAEPTPITVDATIIDGSANPVAGNAVFDALVPVTSATKSPTASTIAKRGVDGESEFASYVKVYEVGGSDNGLLSSTGLTWLKTGVDEATRTVAVQFEEFTGNRIWKQPNASGTYALTASTTGIPDALHNGTISGTVTCADAAAALALRNAAGLGTTDYSANVKVTTLEAVTLLKSPWLVVTSSAILMGNGAGAFKARNTSDTADANFSAGNLTATGTITTTPGARSGPGAVPITVSAVALTTTGVADALTLANGTNGQILTISHVSRGGGTGTAVLTPTTTNGYTTVTFATTGDSVTLQYHTTGGWHVVGSHGVAIA